MGDQPAASRALSIRVFLVVLSSTTSPISYSGGGQTHFGYPLISRRAGGSLLQVKHVVVSEAIRKLLGRLEQLVGNGSNLGASNAWWTDDDARMSFLLADGFAGKENKMSSVAGDQAPALSRCVPQLVSVGQLDVPHLERAYRIDASPTKPLSDPRREVFVEVEPHAR